MSDKFIYYIVTVVIIIVMYYYAFEDQLNDDTVDNLKENIV